MSRNADRVEAAYGPARPRRRRAASTSPGWQASSTKPAFVEKLVPETGTLTAPRKVCPRGDRRPDGRRAAAHLGRRQRQLGAERAARRGTARGSARRSGRGSAASAPNACGLGDERVESAMEHRVEAPLEADRRRRLRLLIAVAAQRAGDVAGKHLDAVGELDQPPERVEEPLGALGGADSEVGPGGVADEERVAGEDEPRLVRRASGRSRRGSSARAGGRACGCSEA